MAQKTITVLVDGQNVKISGNTAGVDVEVQVIGAAANVTSNVVILPWYQRPLGVIVLAVIGGLIVAYAVYRFGWAAPYVATDNGNGAAVNAIGITLPNSH